VPTASSYIMDAVSTFKEDTSFSSQAKKNSRHWPSANFLWP